MNTARPMPGNGSKRSIGSRRGRIRCIRAGSISRPVMNHSHSASSALDTSSREISPPMLCPISTMSCEAGALRCGSKWFRASVTSPRIAAWLSTTGTLVG